MQSLQHPYSNTNAHTHADAFANKLYKKKVHHIKSNGQRSQLQDSLNSEEDKATQKENKIEF